MKVEGSGAGAVLARRRRWRAAGGGFVLKRARRRGQDNAVPPPLRRLLAACRAAFRGPGTVPAPADVAHVRAILDEMGPEDVHLSAELEFFKSMDDADAASACPIVTQTTIFKCKNFKIAIFFLPPSAVIPLHNHPGMTVFTKLLLGSLHLTSYDWVRPAAVLAGSTPVDRRLRLASLVVDADLSAPSETVVLFPESGGNMHRLAAAAPCAVLDVLGPPYAEDRDCTYYEDFPFHHYHPDAGEAMVKAAPPHVMTEEEERQRLGWLRETGMPKELEMYEMPYSGPPIF